MPEQEEEAGWAAAEDYAPADIDAQDDFMAGWRRHARWLEEQASGSTAQDHENGSTGLIDSFDEHVTGEDVALTLRLIADRVEAEGLDPDHTNGSKP